MAEVEQAEVSQRVRVMIMTDERVAGQGPPARGLAGIAGWIRWSASLNVGAKRTSRRMDCRKDRDDDGGFFRRKSRASKFKKTVGGYRSRQDGYHSTLQDISANRVAIRFCQDRWDSRLQGRQLCVNHAVVDVVPISSSERQAAMQNARGD